MTVVIREDYLLILVPDPEGDGLWKNFLKNYKDCANF
jgi:hypothetical protein